MLRPDFGDPVEHYERAIQPRPQRRPLSQGPSDFVTLHSGRVSRAAGRDLKKDRDILLVSGCVGVARFAASDNWEIRRVRPIEEHPWRDVITGGTRRALAMEAPAIQTAVGERADIPHRPDAIHQEIVCLLAFRRDPWRIVVVRPSILSWVRTPSTHLRRLSPRAEIATPVVLDVATLDPPTLAEVADGFTENRDFFPVAPRSLGALHEALADELATLELLAGESSPDEWEAALSEAEYESLAYHELEGLEFGVAGAVLALASTGCVTCYSCRGHGGGGYPQIRFAAGADLAEKLRALVDEAKCGMHIDEEGLLWVFAPSIIEMMHFADLVAASV